MKIGRAAIEAVKAHGAEGYPHEICGILLGPRGGRTATEARRARNIVVDRARDRYEIDPRDHIRIQKEADAGGLDILGYYHSHPDHPAQASRFDTERAWAGYVYVIVSVANGQPVDANAFVADSDGGPFRPEPLETV
ncbi:MAG TPA: M67 family metallopeptidase [Candidatus Limnocylindria bacterium]|jgi:proteasome lid subunit RPN8/RPN11|nr:M67 family metallopeptidase [Candidatus Limnocylindria bacterium]